MRRARRVGLVAPAGVVVQVRGRHRRILAGTVTSKWDGGEHIIEPRWQPGPQGPVRASARACSRPGPCSWAPASASAGPGRPRSRALGSVVCGRMADTGLLADREVASWQRWLDKPQSGLVCFASWLLGHCHLLRGGRPPRRTDAGRHGGIAVPDVGHFPWQPRLRVPASEPGHIVIRLLLPTDTRRSRRSGRSSRAALPR